MKLYFLLVVIATIFDNFRAEEDALYQQLLAKGSPRIRRQTSADQMVQNILQWIQGVYTQNSRKIRQGTLREYLPPSNTQKPRPFEPVSPPDFGYPPAGITPQPPFPIYTNPATGAVTGEGYPTPTNGIPSQSTTQRPGFPTEPPPFTGFPTEPPFTGYPTQKPGFPTQPPPGYSTEPPFTGYPTQKPGFPTQPPPGYSTEPPFTGYPTQKPGFPTQPPPGYSTEYPTQKPGFPTQPPSTSERPGFPTQPPPGFSTEIPTRPPVTSEPTTPPPLTTRPNDLSTSPPGTNPPQFTSPEVTTTGEIGTTKIEDNNVIPEVTTGRPFEQSTAPSVTDEDLKHPPHIHAIDVECAKDQMTINIEFNREFNGVIYSKGYYNTPECRYVNPNSEQTKYKFTVNLNSCGTEFVNAFDTQGQSYLENILVLQNEPGIQEVWDTIRAVRCLWEGNLKESLSVALSVGMLNQELVTFSGDTAVAKLDIQMGRGPFAPSANGLVKIGEPMTLVVSVSGDPGFDIQVKDCRAVDASGDNIVALTDEDGCILKPKLFGAFQKTRNTGSTGASIIAYAFFNAFKFPDIMDLTIECNIELCKTDCQVCPNPDQALEPARRRRKRDLNYYNQTLGNGVTMGKHLRVILAEDLTPGSEIVDLQTDGNVCMATASFILITAITLSLLTISCLFSTYMWMKLRQTINYVK